MLRSVYPWRAWETSRGGIFSRGQRTKEKKKKGEKEEEEEDEVKDEDKGEEEGETDDGNAYTRKTWYRRRRLFAHLAL